MGTPLGALSNALRLLQVSGLSYFILAVVSAVSTLAAFLVRHPAAVASLCAWSSLLHTFLPCCPLIELLYDASQVLLYGTCAGAAYGVATVVATSARIEDERRRREAGCGILTETDWRAALYSCKVSPGAVLILGTYLLLTTSSQTLTHTLELTASLNDHWFLFPMTPRPTAPLLMRWRCCSSYPSIGGVCVGTHRSAGKGSRSGTSAASLRSSGSAASAACERARTVCRPYQTVQQGEMEGISIS